MKDRQFHIYLDDEEYGQVLQALIALKNNLIAQDRYTDAVDDVLIKFTKARKRKMLVYIYAVIAGAAIVFVIRLLAAHFRWSLPKADRFGPVQPQELSENDENTQEI